MTILSISFDDADNPEGGCTTHLAGLFLLELSRLGGVEPADYPLLVRLNPGVPWKTRGNAAVVLRLYSTRSPLDLLEAALVLLDEYTRGRRDVADKGAGVVLHVGAAWREPAARLLYRKALTDVVTVDYVELVARKIGARVYGGRGVIGALSALGALAPGDDYTFELLAYREPHMWGAPRCIADPSVAVSVEAKMPPCTFNNTRGGIVVAAPHGPDPVLAGFRGDCPDNLPAYARLLCEAPHFWVLYRTNQHTDAHGVPLDAIRPYKTGRLTGRVAGKPSTIPGRHVVVPLSTPLGVVDAVFFRETGPMREAASMLVEGDTVTIQGTVRPYKPRGRPTIAVDKLIVHSLAAATVTVAPRCPRCGSRMKSAGRGKGYRCPRCGFYDPTLTPITVPVTRGLSPGVYAPEPGWIRHLTAPPGRRGKALPPHPPASWDSVVSIGPAPPRVQGTPRFPLEPTRGD